MDESASETLTTTQPEVPQATNVVQETFTPQPEEVVQIPSSVLETTAAIPPTPEMERENDIQLFLQEFRGSPTYNEWYYEFYKNKNIKVQVSEAYKKHVFENNAMGNTALYEYSLINPFTYTKENYPEDVQDAISQYVEAARSFRRMFKNPTGKEDMRQMDLMRGATHGMVADKFLEKGFVKTHEQGRFMAHLILVGLGEEKPAPSMSAAQYAAIAASQM